MSKFKQILIWIWIALQVLTILLLWGVAVFTAVTGKPIGEIIRWEWWVFIFTLDLWTAKFFAERGVKPSKKPE
jgi:hypothetical protein